MPVSLQVEVPHSTPWPAPKASPRRLQLAQKSASSRRWGNTVAVTVCLFPSKHAYRHKASGQVVPKFHSLKHTNKKKKKKQKKAWA